MKIKNIAFSGFMAAIMLSTGAAMAAPQIASKAYVDNKSASAATAAVTAALENENGAIKTALDAKADASTVAEVKTTADTAKTTADEAKAAAAAAQATADAAATKTALSEGLALKEDTSNKTGNITTDNQNSASLFPTIGAVTEWTNNKITELSKSGLPVNPDNINDNSIGGSKLANGAVTTEKIADGAVTEGKLSTELAGKVNNAQTSEQVSAAIAGAIKDKADKATTLAGYGITDAMTETEIKGYAVPKPGDDCKAESGRCVLSVDTAGLPYWMDVTKPIDDETAGN